MNRTVVAALFILVALILGLFAYSFLRPDQVSRPVPSISPTPSPNATAFLDNSPSPTPSTSPTVCKKIEVLTPKGGAKVTVPFELEINVDNRCGWIIFEAQAGVATVTQGNKELGVFPLVVDGDWMKPGIFKATATIDPETPLSKGEFEIEITEENPSGMGEVDSLTLTLNY